MNMLTIIEFIVTWLLLDIISTGIRRRRMTKEYGRIVRDVVGYTIAQGQREGRWCGSVSLNETLQYEREAFNIATSGKGLSNPFYVIDWRDVKLY